MLEFKSKVLLVFLALFLVGCELKKNSDPHPQHTVIFLDHRGDTIIKCRLDAEPKIKGIKKVVGRNYYIQIDSLEHLKGYVAFDTVSGVKWQIKQE